MVGTNTYWLGKKRPELQGAKNARWSGGKQEKKCFCGKKFEISSYRLNTAKFCSHSCRAKFYFTGEKNVNWKGGISSWKDQVKASKEYGEWRITVFRRDRFTCRWCGHRSAKSKAHGDKSSDIHAHHIIPMVNNKELWFVIINGITLCVPCHRKTYGKENQFATELKEILNDYMSNIPKG